MDWLLSVIDARACWLLRPSTYIWCDVQHRRTQDFDAWIKFKLCMQKPIDNQTPLSQKQPKKKNTTPHASFPKIREKKEEEPTLAILHLQRRYLALHPAQKIDPPKLQSRQPFRPGIMALDFCRKNRHLQPLKRHWEMRPPYNFSRRSCSIVFVVM